MQGNPSGGARALSQIDIANSRELPADGNTNTRHPRCVSRLNAVTDTRPRTYQLSTIFKEIHRGTASLANLADDAPYRTLAQVTARARELRYTHGNLDAYNLLKKEMPQFTPAAVLSTRSEIQSFSELVCLEWDADVDVAYALTIGKQHPNVLAIWRSLSGKPKFLIPISPVSKDGDELIRDTFKHAWFDASLLFEDIGEADPTAMDPTHLQALCYDPDLYVNWDAIPVEWTIDDGAFAEAYPNLIETENVAYAELPVEYHIAIQDMVWKPDGWGETSVPCPFGENHEHDGWGSRSNGTGIHKNGENDYTFHCLKCPKSKRYSENPEHPKRRAPVRLSHIPGHVPESAPLETVRKLNNEGVSKWLRDINPSIPEYQDPVKPILQKIMGKERVPIKNRWHSEQIGWWNCAKGSWAAMRKIVRDRIKRNRFMLVMTGGAGGGKSTAVREHLKHFVDISPTTAQADEKYDDALNLGRNAMRHRSRNYNRELADNYTPESVPLGLDAEFGCVPCAFPDICNNLSQIGGSPVTEFCKPHCPRFEECTDYGYLSQWRVFKDYSEIYLSYQDDIFSDPIHAGYIEQMGGSKKDFVLCLDEADPASLPPERGYVTDRLKRAADDYAGFESGEFLKALLRETSTVTTPLDWTHAVKSVLDMYDNDALNEIDEQLRGIPVSVEFEKVETVEYDLNGRALYFTIAHITYGDKKQTCAVIRDEIDDGVYQMCTKTDYPSISENIVPVDGYTPGVLYDRFLYLETFCRIGFGNLKTADDVLKLPRRYRNLTADLRAFIDTVSSETPAVRKNIVSVEIDGKKQEVIVGWTFYLRPDMNARRGILISASGGFNEILQIYSHTNIIIEHITTPPAEWEPRNKVFQIPTGRYTPKSALFITENGEIVGITERGQSFLSAIHTEVSQNPHRSLVVAPKPLTAEGELSELDEVKALCELEHVDVTNHWHAEGTNRYTGVESLFILHYEPPIDEFQSIVTRIYRNETISFERKKIDLEKAGVKLQGVNRYTDPRVQAVFDRECEKRIYQALMRGRQMIDTGVDCYVFLFTAEPISGLPIAPIFFELDDLVKCHEEHGTIRKLEEYLASKTELSVKELAELDGKSVSTTYKRTAEQRKQTKADKDAELLWNAEQLLHKGMSQVGVANMLGISRGKLQSLLKQGAA